RGEQEGPRRRRGGGGVERPPLEDQANDWLGEDNEEDRRRDDRQQRQPQPGAQRPAKFVRLVDEARQQWQHRERRRRRDQPERELDQRRREAQDRGAVVAGAPGQVASKEDGDLGHDEPGRDWGVELEDPTNGRVRQVEPEANGNPDQTPSHGYKLEDGPDQHPRDQRRPAELRVK